MDVKLMAKRVLVLSDDERLARAIELNLRHCAVEIVRVVPDRPWQEADVAALGPIDLIVAAVSSLTTRSATIKELAGRASHVPLLLISDRHTYTDLDRRATHLDFPFDVNDLCRRVMELLQKSTDQDGGDRDPGGQR